MQRILYQDMKPGEEKAVCELVSQVFNQFVAPDYGQEGIEAFFRFTNPRSMRERMQLGGFVLVARQADPLAGMMEFAPPDHVAMLFVSLRRQGIAKHLLTRAICKARAINPNVSTLTVHSSPYAEAIYLKMGFRRTGDDTTENGITYTPMQLILQNGSV
jgi:GNAT superfamily N-acetyltransferase